MYHEQRNYLTSLILCCDGQTIQCDVTKSVAFNWVMQHNNVVNISRRRIWCSMPNVCISWRLYTFNPFPSSTPQRLCNRGIWKHESMNYWINVSDIIAKDRIAPHEHFLMPQSVQKSPAADVSHFDCFEGKGSYSEVARLHMYYFPPILKHLE